MSNIAYKTIVEKAKIIKKSVEQNQKMLNHRWGYYVAKAILNPGKNIPNIGKYTYAPRQHGDHISTQISKKDYLDCCKRITAYVEKFKTMPNFVQWKNRKIKTDDYTYNFAKIIIWYNNHKTLPAYNNINTKIWNKPEPVKKHGHATSSGCDNRGQNNGYYCGCHSLQEVFRNLTGIVVPQSTIASVAGTTTDGTDHDGLNTTVEWFNRKYNKKLTVQWYNFSDLGWNGIRNIINSNNKDLVCHNLYRNTWGHYEVINKVYDDYCDVQNSLGDYCDYDCYCGYVEERSLSTFRSYISGISQKSIMVITNAG